MISDTRPAFDIDPEVFYSMIDVIDFSKSKKSQISAGLDERLAQAYSALDEMNVRCEILERSNSNMMHEWRMTIRERKEDPASRRETDWADEFRHTAEGMNFVRVAYDVCSALRRGTQLYVDAIRGLRTPDLMMAGKKPELKSIEDAQRMHYTIQLNAPAVRTYAEGLLALDALPESLAGMTGGIVETLASYYRALSKRHSTDGFEIHGNALLTDVAMHVYENVDSDGEVAEGRNPNDISAYSARKANLMAEAIQDPFVNALLTEEGGFVEFVRNSIRGVFDSACQLAELLRDDVQKLRAVARVRGRKIEDAKRRVSGHMSEIADLDPAAVRYREKKDVLLTQDERYRLSFKNETLKQLVRLYKGSAQPAEVIAYVLSRKEKLRKYLQDENSFFVCRIGVGNPFLSEAPGELQVVPGPRPTVSFDDIMGSGFGELKTFHKTIRGSAAWSDLFTATSPSRSAGKSNILLIGPQGCGKCVTGDTMVFTDRGLVRIDSLNPGVDDDGYGDLSICVRSLHGTTKSANFYDSGIQPVIRISSRLGYEVEGTDKHRLVCAGEYGPEWRRHDEIKQGDYVAIVRDGLPFGTGPSATEKAYVYGYYVGDGSTSGPASKPRAIRFSVAATDLDDFKLRAYPYLESVGKPSAYPDSRGKAYYDVQVSGMGKEAVLSFRGECGHGCSNKRVPEWVLMSGKETWKSFLNGLFDADGSTYGRRVEFSSNSHGLVRIVQTMLLAFGVVSTVQNKDSNPRCWRLFIYGENLRRFHRNVGFGLPRKSDRLATECLSTVRNDNYDTIPVSKGLWARLKSEAGPLSREIHKSMDHYARGGHMPGRTTLMSILNQIPECDAKRSILMLATEEYQWDRVEDVTFEGSKPVYDLVIPYGGSFAANGFMNHNTEALRAVATEEDSVAIFVTGSDFLTCWKGEAMKNPKRLFEQAIKIQKDSGKHVHILLDEADAVMRKKEFQAYGDDDFTTEFQNLMDGVVHYPNITVWGATNHPERIPIPLIRRFSKVLIVGELSTEERTDLLRKFLSYLPTEDFEGGELRSWSSQLEGATGDVIRKIADHVWRTKMQWFVDEHPAEAEKAKKWLNRNGKFEIAEFSSPERAEFKAMLGEKFRVAVRDVQGSVDAHLRNLAIRTEIQAARESYANARKVVSELSNIIVI